MPKKKADKSYLIELEVAMDENCEGSPNLADVIYRPIGRVHYNKSKSKFDYDKDYTFRMGARYDDRRRKRCALVAEKLRAQKKIEKLQ